MCWATIFHLPCRTARLPSCSQKIAWWPGHSTGRYAGSTWFADAFALDLDDDSAPLVGTEREMRQLLPTGDRFAVEADDDVVLPQAAVRGASAAGVVRRV